MKKVFKLMAVTGVMFGLSISAISASIDTKTIGEGKTVSLRYGTASAKDKRTDHSYNFQTTGRCNNSMASLAVYVKDGKGTTKSSDSCRGGESCEATWFSSGKVSHSHTASSALIM